MKPMQLIQLLSLTSLNHLHLHFKEYIKLDLDPAYPATHAQTHQLHVQSQ